MAKTYYVSDNGRVRRLDNYTAPWIDVSTGEGRDLADVMTNPDNEDHVVIVGGAPGYVRVSTNAGATWNTPGGNWATIADRPLIEVWWQDANTIYAVGQDGATIKSTDGGATFNVLPNLPTPSGSYEAGSARAVHAFSANDVLVAFDNYLFRSTDGGTTWNPVFSGNPLAISIGFITGIYMNSNGTTYTVVSPSLALHSVNSGNTWTTAISIPNRRGVHLTALNDDELWISGDNQFRAMSTDAGLNFGVISSDVPFPDSSGRAMHMYDSNNGFFSTDNTLYVTADGGSTGAVSDSVPENDINAVWTRGGNPPTPSCYQLDNCDAGAEPQTIFTQVDLSSYVGGVVTLADPYSGCYTVQDLGPIGCPGSVDVTVTQQFDDCDSCLYPERYELVSCSGDLPDIIDVIPDVGIDLASEVGNVIKFNGGPDCYIVRVQEAGVTGPVTVVLSIDESRSDCSDFTVPTIVCFDSTPVGTPSQVVVDVTNNGADPATYTANLVTCTSPDIVISSANPIVVGPGLTGSFTLDNTATNAVQGSCTLEIAGPCGTQEVRIDYNNVNVPDCPHFNICITGPSCAPDCIKPGEVVQFDLGGNISPIAYPTTITFSIVNQVTQEVVYTETHDVANDTELDAIIINWIAEAPGSYCAEICLPGCRTKRTLCFDVCEPFDIYKDECNHWHVHRPHECKLESYNVCVTELEGDCIIGCDEDNPEVWDVLQDNTYEFEVPHDGIYIFEMKDPATGEVQYSFALFETCEMQRCFKILMDKIMCSCADPCCTKCNGTPEKEQEFARMTLNKLFPLYFTYLGYARRNELYQLGMKLILDEHYCFLHDASATLDKIQSILEDCDCLCKEESNTASNRGDCLSC